MPKKFVLIFFSHHKFLFLILAYSVLLVDLFLPFTLFICSFLERNSLSHPPDYIYVFLVFPNIE